MAAPAERTVSATDPSTAMRTRTAQVEWRALVPDRFTPRTATQEELDTISVFLPNAGRIQTAVAILAESVTRKIASVRSTGSFAIRIGMSALVAPIAGVDESVAMIRAAAAGLASTSVRPFANRRSSQGLLANSRSGVRETRNGTSAVKGAGHSKARCQRVSSR